MNVELRAALEDDEGTVANLMSLYLFEQSGPAERESDDDGMFRYENLSVYWQQPGRYPFLIRADERLAGFVLIAHRGIFDRKETGHVVAEFFVLPSFRRRGVGQEAARQLFDRFPGQWWIGEASWNDAGQEFWRAVVAAYTHGSYNEETFIWADQEGVAQTFVAEGSV